MPEKILVNFGCGSLFRSGWQNFDIDPADSSIHNLDATKEWPIGAGTVDLFYCSHLLEHIAPHMVNRFLEQVFTVLRPGGIFRVVVPDLAQIATAYLEAYKQAQEGGASERLRHQWMVTELVDQLARQYPDGGEMFRFFIRNGEKGLAVARNRLGMEMQAPLPWDAQKTKEDYIMRISNDPKFSDEMIFKRRNACSFEEIGKFRTSGKPHLWMYDKVSLGELLSALGLSPLIQQTAHESLFDQFSKFCLDTDESGNPRKPDSIYFEGVKPA